MTSVMLQQSLNGLLRVSCISTMMLISGEMEDGNDTNEVYRIQVLCVNDMSGSSDETQGLEWLNLVRP